MHIHYIYPGCFNNMANNGTNNTTTNNSNDSNNNCLVILSATLCPFPNECSVTFDTHFLEPAPAPHHLTHKTTATISWALKRLIFTKM